MKKEEYKKAKTISISAVIPIKFNSTRCPEKNYRFFSNSSLIDICVDKLRDLPFIDEIVISIDDKRLAPILEHLNNVRIVLRDDSLCDPMVPMNLIYSHLAEICINEHIVYTSCTTPLIQINHYKEGYEKWARNNFTGSVHTVSQLKDFLLKEGTPLNFDKRHFPRSQDLPDLKKLVYGFAYITKNEFLKGSSLAQTNCGYINIPFPFEIDIDTELDFKAAQLLYEKV